MIVDAIIVDAAYLGLYLLDYPIPDWLENRVSKQKDFESEQELLVIKSILNAPDKNSLELRAMVLAILKD